MRESWLERWGTVNGVLAVLVLVSALMLADQGALSEPLLALVAGTVFALSVAYILARRRAVKARIREWDAIATAAGLERTEEKGSLHAWVRLPTYGRKDADQLVFLEPTGEGDGSAILVVTSEWADETGAGVGTVQVADASELRARIDEHVGAFRAGTEPPADLEERPRFGTVRGIVAVLALVAFVGIHALRLVGMGGASERWNVDGLLVLLGVGVAYLLLMFVLTLMEGRREARRERAIRR